MTPGYPSVSRATSARRAARTASETPPLISEKGSQPLTAVTLPGKRVSKPFWSVTALSFSPKPGHEPNIASPEDKYGPIRAIFDLSERGSTSPSFFRSTIDSLAIERATSRCSGLYMDFLNLSGPPYLKGSSKRPKSYFTIRILRHI